MNIRETNNINTENPQWRNDHESLIIYFQNVFDEYQEGKIDFHEYKYKLVGSSSGLEEHINFKGSRLAESKKSLNQAPKMAL